MKIIGLSAFTSLAFLFVGMGVAAPPKARARYRFSILGILSGIVGGLGALILVQQYAVAYPTNTLMVGAPVAGVLLSLVLTNLAASAAARRAKRQVGTAAPATATASAPAPPPEPAPVRAP